MISIIGMVTFCNIDNIDVIKTDNKKINILHIIICFLSPTFYFARQQSQSIENKYSKKVKEYKKATAKKSYNLIYFLISFTVIILLLFSDSQLFNVYITITHSQLDLLCKYLFIPFTIYLFSRSIEIFYAFGKDAFDRLNKSRPNTALKFHERIKLALRSYIELIINYALLYYFITVVFFIYELKLPFINLIHVFDSLYYSSLIVTTIGFDVIKPIHEITKFLTFFEVLNGMILVVVSFTIYVSRSIEDKESKEN
ncbi:two pore domain potassium channel family protein [Poseidonibacter lekithochrous]|uniref:two pore domain potassium channel family protein n=1 Tax=Poseidonibacter lekithochrous TaxID=1904463 RepID=UPI0013DC3364|nr:two pore domain potassium channel family protein [Poseidonibacter lekithochrous]